MEDQTATLVGDELIIAVFHYFPKNRRLSFKEDIMQAFYKASKNHDYKDLFEHYHFDEDGVMPYSKEIEEGIFTLQVSGIFTYGGLSGQYIISGAASLRFNKRLKPHLTDVQKELIKKLAQEIREKLIGKLNV